jgi:hypothetical protein
MRRGTFYALGALATVGVAALSQSLAAQQMMAIPVQEMLRMRPFVLLPQSPPPPQAPQVQFRGCVYYEHANWGGKWRSIPGGTRRIAVGPSWNDIISSLSCNPACRVVAFTDDFKGQRGDFSTTAYVGDPWNDKISSMIAVCQHPF